MKSLRGAGCHQVCVALGGFTSRREVGIEGTYLSYSNLVEFAF